MSKVHCEPSTPLQHPLLGHRRRLHCFRRRRTPPQHQVRQQFPHAAKRHSHAVGDLVASKSWCEFSLSKCITGGSLLSTYLQINYTCPFTMSSRILQNFSIMSSKTSTLVCNFMFHTTSHVYFPVPVLFTCIFRRRSSLSSPVQTTLQ